MLDNKLPTSIVIFGASGDLTKRKLIPALYNLWRKNRMPKNFNIIGFSRSKFEHGEFIKEMKAGVDKFVDGEVRDEDWQKFSSKIHYIPGGFSSLEDYQNLNEGLKKFESRESNRLYYLATPPRFFSEIIANLAAVDMIQEENIGTERTSSWKRVVIEKPFGVDLDSAQALNQSIHKHLTENQIYRIDHYLAKETVQNILFFRFGNTMFEPLWNRNYIDHVQITVAEQVDVEHRAEYFDKAGLLRDMFQNHLMQLLALVSMEPPTSFEANAVRNEKVKALSAVRKMSPSDIQQNTVRAQYDGYLDSPNVAYGSQTPTYAALKLQIDSWRWQGVPFYLRSGKAMTQKATEIIIQFKRPPHSMFNLPEDQSLRSNFLALCIQPHEGIHQRIELKVPDTAAEMRSVDMDFHYEEAFGEGAIPEAYERLLLNALEGDATLFTRSDGIEAAWKIIDPIHQAWESNFAPPMTNYLPDSWGPKSAEELLSRDGRQWRFGCSDHK